MTDLRARLVVIVGDVLHDDDKAEDVVDAILDCPEVITIREQAAAYRCQEEVD